MDNIAMELGGGGKVTALPFWLQVAVGNDQHDLVVQRFHLSLVP